MGSNSPTGTPIRDPEKAKSTIVYLITGDRQRFKIGKTSNLMARFCDLQLGSPIKLSIEFFVTTPWATWLETYLHRKFSKRSVRGEWFELTEEEVEYIKSLTTESVNDLFESSSKALKEKPTSGRKGIGGRPSVFPPKIHEHRGTERVCWKSKWYYLGKVGSEYSRAEYSRLIALWAVDPNAVPLRSDDYLVSELAADFLESDQAPRDKRQRDIAIRAVELLLEHHLRTPVAEFGPMALSSWQSWLCRQVHPIPMRRAGKQRWNRTYIGHLVRVVRSIWKWGVASERIAEERYRALLTVKGPRYGECREPTEVAAADPGAVDKVLPYLRGPVRAMLLLQRSTGARPGELCAIRPRDVHQTGKVRLPWTGAMFDCDAEGVWVYLPSSHKGTSRRKLRAIYFARQDQEILRPFLDRDPESLCFSPREAVGELRAAQRAARIASGGGSGGSRKPRSQAPGRAPSDQYTPRAYYVAIRRACLATGVEPFTPYSVRHLVGQEVDHDFGLDAARDVLGHSDPRTTTRYAKANAKRAAEVARRRGV